MGTQGNLTYRFHFQSVENLHEFPRWHTASISCSQAARRAISISVRVFSG